MEKKEVQIAVIGAGLAGLATAHYLLKKKAGTVAILEMEKGPGLAASTQNAAMICRFDEDPATAALCAEGAHQLEKDLAPSLGSIGFRRCGSVFVSSRRDDAKLRQMAKNAAAANVIPDTLTRAETLKLFPFLADSPFDSALYCNADAIVDVKMLVDKLAAKVAAQGATFAYARAARVMPETGGYMIRSASSEIFAKQVVNASGAWAADVARNAGAQSIAFEPMRRHLFVTADLRWANPEWPIVWDVTNETYFRSEGKKLWFSPCDETRYKAGPVDPDPKIEKTMREKMTRVLPCAKDAEWSTAWAGLRTFSPDRRFVIGEDRNLQGFFWAAGLGGHGVTACAAVGQTLASLMTGEKIPATLAQAFTPKRFA